MKFMKWIDNILLGKKPEMKIVKSRDLGNGWYEVDGLKFKSSSHAEAINTYRRAINEDKKMQSLQKKSSFWCF